MRRRSRPSSPNAPARRARRRERRPWRCFGLVPAYRDLPLRGEGVYLRGSEMRDFVAWASLRERSRAFLTPWEPTWPSDDLTRASFRYRVRRHAEEMARDEAYSFFVFREADDVLVGGLTLGHVRRGVSQAATLGYWMGEPYAGKGYMSRAVRAALDYAFNRQRLHRIEAACLPSNAPRSACWSAMASSRRASRGPISTSTASGATICSSRGSTATRRPPAGRSERNASERGATPARRRVSNPHSRAPIRSGTHLSAYPSTLPSAFRNGTARLKKG